MNSINPATTEQIRRLENDLGQYIKAYQRALRLNSGTTGLLGMIAKTATALWAAQKSI